MKIDKMIMKPSTKKEVEAMAKNAVIATCESGKHNSLELYALLKRMESFASAGLKAAKSFAMDEYNTYSYKEDCAIQGVVYSAYVTKPSPDLMSDNEYARISAEIINKEHKYLRKLRQELKDRGDLLKQSFTNKMDQKKGQILDEDGAIVEAPKVLKMGAKIFKATY